MDSSSTMIAGSCFHCKSYSHQLISGWLLNCGSHAQLCNRCGEAYHSGTFCSIFHMGIDGWRDCNDCGMDLHCGCIMSAHIYEEWDLGGVVCKKCLHKLHRTTSKGVSYSLIDLNADPNDLESLADPSEVVVNDESNSVACEGNEEAVDNNEEHVSPDTVIVPLFKKVLTTSDTDLKLGRLLVPKTHALVHFPKIEEPSGFPIKMRDETGGEWDFHYHYWKNSKSNIYVLDGLRDYMVFKEWQAGDMVEFYRTEPGGKLVIFTRKLFVHLPPARPPPPPLPL